MKEELISLISKWITHHPNSYDRSINESVYWTMNDLLNIIHNTNDDKVLKCCETIFNRFKFYY